MTPAKLVSYVLALCMSLVAWALIPNSVAYGAPQESPVMTSVCEVGSPSSPHPYPGRKVSIEGIVAYDLRGVIS